MTYAANIVDYYRRSNWLYETFWYSKASLGLHYGFWTEGTKTHDEAIVNQYKDVIRKGKITKGMKVLDAGCGVGGGAIYIAKKTGAKVTGITLVKEQAEMGNEIVKRERVESLANFTVGDYMSTGFADSSFDVVYGIESICYAYPKIKFLKEAYRILKPGGRLVINDGYCKRAPESIREKKIIRDFCRGWRLKELAVVDEMTETVKKVGFKNIKIEDMTKAIEPSLERMKLLVWLAYVPAQVGTYLKIPWLSIIAENVLSMRMSIDGVRTGLGGYFSHVGEK